MEAIRNNYQRVIELYQAMSPVRQRTLLVAMIAIMLALLVFMPSRPSALYVAVLNGQVLQDAQFDRAEQELTRAGLTDHRREGQCLLAPHDQITRYNNVLTNTDLDDLSRDRGFGPLSGILSTPRQQDHLKELALRKELERVICDIPAIQDATVIWARGNTKSGWHRESKVTATANVQPQRGFELTPALRHSLRAAVANMVADLKPEDVVILDQSTGQTYSFAQDDDPLSALTNQVTHAYRSRIREALAYIPHILVTVNVELHTPQISSSVLVNTASDATERLSSHSNVLTKAVRVAVGIPEDYFAAVFQKRVFPGSGHNQYLVDSSKRFDIAKQEEIQKIKATVAGLLLEDTRPDSITVSSYVRGDSTNRQARIDTALLSGNEWVPWMCVIGLLGLTVLAIWLFNRRASIQSPPLAALGTEPPCRQHIDAQLGDETDEVTFERPLHEPVLSNEADHSWPSRNEQIVPFAFLKDVNHEHLYNFIVLEQPQTIALIVSHLPDDLGTRLIDALPPEKRSKVQRRIQNMEPIVPEVIDGVSKTLQDRILAQPSGHDSSYDYRETQISTEPPDDVHVFSDWETIQDVESWPSHESSVFHNGMFDDLGKLPPSALRELFRQVDVSQWAIALKGASGRTKRKLLENLSTRDKERLKEEINQLGPVRISDIEKTQQLVMDQAARLEMLV